MIKRSSPSRRADLMPGTRMRKGRQPRAGALLLAACLSAPGHAATPYFVSDCASGADTDCQAGSDSNDGRSPYTPWKTLAKAFSTFNNMEAGDSILLAKGAAFLKSSEANLFNRRCSANDPCTIDRYVPPWASGDEQDPLIIADKTHGISFANGGAALGDGGYAVRNLRLSGTGYPYFGVFLFNDVNDVVLDSLRIERFYIGVHSAGANPAARGADRSNDNLTLRNSIISDNSGFGFLGSANNLLIENNRFTNNGFAKAVFNHNLYIAAPTAGLTYHNIVIRNNELFQSTLVDGRCQGVSLVVHGLQDNLLIEDNHIHETAGRAAATCWGIAIDNGYRTAEGFRNAVVRRNRLKNMHNVGIGVAACSNCRIEANTIISESARGFTGILAPSKPGKDIDHEMTGLRIVGNAIFMTGSDGTGTGIKVADAIAVQEVSGNIVSYDGGRTICHGSPVSGAAPERDGPDTCR